MEESGESVTSFKLKFPANRDFIVGDIENIEQRSCLYIGQCVEILCFAINNDVHANEVTLQKWCKHICSLSIYLSSINHESSILTMRRDGQKRKIIRKMCI